MNLKLYVFIEATMVQSQTSVLSEGTLEHLQASQPHLPHEMGKEMLTK